MRGVVIVLAVSVKNVIIFLILFTSSVMSGCGDQDAAVTAAADTPQASQAESTQDNSVHKIVSGEQAWDIYETNSGAILLDVRTQEEYEEGHIDGSVLIPVSELEHRLSELPDKDAVIIVYCRGGVRSAAAYEILDINGYKQVFDMQQITNWPEPLVTD